MTPKRFENAKVTDIPSNVMEKLNAIFDTRKGLYLYGGCGVGKTHIAYAITDWAREKSLKNKIVSVPEMLRRVKKGFEKNADIDDKFFLDDLIDFTGLLILDDLGAEKGSEFVSETLYTLINKRYEEVLPTIFTSNLNPEQLVEKLGDRIVSRIVGSSELIELTGKDRRI